ncbi:hypothetical protein SAMN04487939_106121 [Lysobacter sp. yr284]|uniref:hypothetical protein n=1 Tax=Lysobacter sp. yr284 TaxID=1761791 RepID=UPI00089BB2E8|nr:hypothetical protein [Lysobacter sp. yr284]SDY79494.1 hypothetical protein SAMN04487939_106121 [Lysobacter sp. yr284]
MADPRQPSFPPGFLPPGYDNRRQLLYDLARNDIASAITNDSFDPQERVQLVKDLARREPGFLFPPGKFFGDFRSDEQVGRDRHNVGKALDQAIRDPSIDAADLKAIAGGGGPNGQQRLLSLLQEGGGGPGSGVEKYADTLWQKRNEPGNGNAAAVAAIAYMSDPKLRDGKLGSAAERREAFEALVAFNEQAPYAKMSEPEASQMKRQSLAAAATLFAQHGPELIDAYTTTPGATTPLSKFFSQTMYNPDAKDVTVQAKAADGSTVAKDMQSAIGDVLKQAATDRIKGADVSDRQGQDGPSRTQELELTKLARLGAAVTGGAVMAWDTYKDKIQANEESRKGFMDAVGKGIGLMPGGGLAKEVGEGAAKLALDKLSRVYVTDPKTPEVAMSDTLNQYYAGLVEGLANKRQQSGLTTDTFGQAYQQEMDRINQKRALTHGKSAEADVRGVDAPVQLAGLDAVDRLSAAMRNGDRSAYRQDLAALAAGDGGQLRDNAAATVAEQDKRAKDAPAPNADQNVQVAQAETAPAIRRG